MTRSLVLGVVLGAATLAQQPAAQATEERNCDAALQRHLADLGVASGDVEEIYVQRRARTRSQTAKLVGYGAWIDLKSCPDGQLVVVMSRQCNRKTAYTTGACRVPGLGR